MMKPSTKKIATATACRVSMFLPGAIDTISITSTKTTNHGSWRGPSSRLPSSSGIISAVSGTTSRQRRSAATSSSVQTTSTNTVRYSGGRLRRAARRQLRRSREVRASRADSRRAVMFVDPVLGGVTAGLVI
jgi:hypothetical protein